MNEPALHRLPVPQAVRQAQEQIRQGTGRRAALRWLAEVAGLTFVGAVDMIDRDPEDIQRSYDELGREVAATRARVQQMRAEGHPGRRG
ncbi:hypothetical protein ACFXOL_31865 [Streptomyces californicus]|uniref:hypothetical protein n=1 Tax=Streptomyces californicus TaxID=67351 RepID=UPI00364F3485